MRFASMVGLAFVLTAALAAAAEPKPAGPVIREILVPFEDLHVLLEGQPRRVMLAREAYETLLKKASRTPEAQPPQAAMLVEAEYQVRAESQRATLSGALSIEVLSKGLHALALDLGGVGLRNAVLDGSPAPIGRGEKGPPTLFVEGLGRHRLELEMVAPLETNAARQVLHFRLPRPPSARLRLTAPGDVEVKSGAEVLRREFDRPANATRFDLLAPRGDATLVLSLNSRLQRQDRAVVAWSVQVDEVTQAYERLHATINLEILHQVIDSLRFVVPEGFEVTDVASPMLARWSVQREGDRQVLGVQLREQTGEAVVLNVAALRTPPRLGSWGLPRLEPLEVVGQASVVGLLLEERLKAESLRPQGLIPINTTDLTGVLPASLLRAEPGSPVLIPVAAYYAPHGDYQLSARFNKPPAQVAATYNLLLTLDEQGQHLQGGIMLRPEAEKMFAFEFQLPARWQVLRVSGSNGQELAFDSRILGEHARIQVPIPQGVPCGQETRFDFQAICSLSEWLTDWQTQQVEFPAFAIPTAGKTQAAIAVVARDDMSVRPEQLRRLTPLDETAKGQYGLGGVETSLAYRCESQDCAATLSVDRTQPRITARAYSFLRVQPDALDCHYELVYQVDNARTRKLALLLPATTPAALSIRGLDGLALKEFSSLPGAAGLRRWNVLLEEPHRGRVRLAVDFQQTLPSLDAANGEKSLSLPLVRADGVAHQAGLVAVEGSTDMEVQVQALQARRVDVGELAEADYQPGNRLLGVFGYVAEAADLRAQARINVLRHPAYPIQSAIAGRAELHTVFSVDGMSLTTATFRLHTKALLLEMQLPQGSRLWAVTLDRHPLAPQREDHRLLVSLPGMAGTSCELQVVYQTPVSRVAGGGRLDLDAPSLLLHARRDAPAAAVPLADLLWSVELPSGYEVVGSGGTLVSDEIRPPRPAIVELAQWLWNPFGSALILARASAPRETAQPYLPQAKDAATTAQAPPAAAKNGMPVPEVRMHIERDEMRSEERKQVEKLGLKKAPLEAAAQSRAKQNQQLLGVRSLQIDTRQAGETCGRPVTFRSLGESPRLEIDLAPTAETESLGLALALAVFVVGMTLTCRSALSKTRYVIAVAVVAMLVGPLSGSIRAAQIADMAFFAAAVLVGYYLLAGLVRWTVTGRTDSPGCRAPTSAAAAGAAVLLLVAVWPANTVHAAPKDKSSSPYVIQVVEPPKPVRVPDDVILRPYDPGQSVKPGPNDKLLIPYAKYTELWNRAYPDQKLDQPKPPAQYALAGGTYRASLEGDDYLVLSGRLEVELFGDEHVMIPLGLQGGVLARATLDGRPAQLMMPVPRKGAEQPESRGVRSAEGPAASTMLVLQAAGKGRHRLELEVRLRLERRGGWRVAEGLLPAATATALSLVVPQALTEVRLARIDDRSNYETEKPGEVLHTSLGSSGAVSIQWRPKIAEAQVDLSLTITSQSTFDVQEDGLRLLCHLQLEFRRSQRDFFRLEVPVDYLVERVEGSNVRGWEMRKEQNRQSVEIALLKTARDSETLLLHLSRQAAVGDHLTEFDVPVVTAAGAALHSGRVTIRRSPLLDLRTVESKGLSRADLSAKAAAGPDKAAVQSPLGLKPYQAWEFPTTPFLLRLAAAPVAAKLDARWQTVLRIAEYERSVESRLIVRSPDRPLHALEIFVPEDLQLRHVTAPGEFQWAITRSEGQRLLSVYLAAGQRGELQLLIRGTLGEPGTIEAMELPRFELRGAQRQGGEIAVQVDPAFDVEPESLAHIQPLLLRQTHGWLNPRQRQATRLALEFQKPDYGGKLRLRTRAPSVSCYTITNVRVTREAIEETILLEFNVEGAGIRQISFLLPQSDEPPRIEVPMLRQKTLQNVGEGENARLRVQLELQDERMGQLRVLVHSDRALTSASNQAPIPVVETGRTDRQFVALEASGRDEVVVEAAEGLETISRAQKEWQTLRGILKGNMVQAYLVSPAAERPRLLLRTRDRETVETAAARIGLAETALVLDAHGAYRAAVTYWIDNATEQFLDVDLPAGATLWTAQVADEPVKPTRDPEGNSPQRVRIPLVKTPVGQPHYPIVLKYAGQLSQPRWLGQTEFPLVRTARISVQLSQLRLYLPETHQWFNFSDKMRMATSEDDLADRRVELDVQNAQRLLDKVRHGEDYEKARAANTLKNFFRGSSGGILSSAREASRQSSAIHQRREALLKAQQELSELESQSSSKPQEDNRRQLEWLYQSQSNDSARNVVQGAGSNWGETVAKAAKEQKGQFNTDWLRSNVLQPAETGKADLKKSGTELLTTSAAPPAVAQPSALSSRLGRQAKTGGDLQFAAQAVGQKLEGGRETIQEREDRAADRSGQQLPAQQDKLQRYQQRLEEQSRPDQYFGYAQKPMPAQGQSALADGAHFERAGGGQPSAVSGYVTGPAATYTPGAAPSSPATAPTDESQLAAGEQPGASPARGLASLSFDLPKRGRVFLFTTPRGEVEMSAWGVSEDLLRRLKRALLAMVVLALGLIALALARRGGFAWLLTSSGGAVLAAAGLFGLCAGLQCLVALLMIGAGLCIVLLSWARRLTRTLRQGRA